MKVLLKKATVYDDRSSHHLQERDILINNGRIEEIKSSIQDKQAKVIEGNRLSVSSAWIDTACYNGEPGKEQREDLQSLKRAALNGGFGTLIIAPNSDPAIDTKAQIDYILNKNLQHPVQIYPIAALTKGCEGTEMSDIMDLANAGAIAFGDGFKSLYSKAQLMRLLQYVASQNKLLIHNVAGSTGRSGQIHEGSVSVSLGLEGIPLLTEHMEVADLLKIQVYAGGRLLIHTISDFQKAVYRPVDNEDIVYSVGYLNLVFQDKDLSNFNENLKVLPPIRSGGNRLQLIKAIKRGELAIICSNHRPLSLEEYDEPFGMRPFGGSSIETLFPALNSLVKELSTEEIVRALTTGPGSIFPEMLSHIEVGNAVRLTVFDTNAEIQIETGFFRSKSQSNPFFGKMLRGKVIGLLSDGSIHLN